VLYCFVTPTDVLRKHEFSFFIESVTCVFLFLSDVRHYLILDNLFSPSSIEFPCMRLCYCISDHHTVSACISHFSGIAKAWKFCARNGGIEKSREGDQNTVLHPEARVYHQHRELGKEHHFEIYHNSSRPQT
jgi:hypothetical protein